MTDNKLHIIVILVLLHTVHLQKVIKEKDTIFIANHSVFFYLLVKLPSFL